MTEVRYVSAPAGIDTSSLPLTPGIYVLDGYRLHYSSGATQKRGQAQGHKSARSGGLCGTDPCPWGPALDGDFVMLGERECWLQARSPLEPRTHCQPSEWVRCFPPPLFLSPTPFFLHLLLQRRPAAAISKRNGPYLSCSMETRRKALLAPTRTDSPALLDAAGKCRCTLCPEFPAAPAQL